MKRELTVKTYRPSAECVRINELARSALNGASAAKKQIYVAGAEARRCGVLLLAEKSKITKEMGRGYWASYFEINHGKIFNIRTAQRWMAMINEISEIGNDTSAQSVVLEPKKANELRGTMVALEIFPKKTSEKIKDDKQASRNSSFIVIGNRFKAWHANWKKVNGDIPPNEEQLKTFREDVGAMLNFLGYRINDPNNDPEL